MSRRILCLCALSWQLGEVRRQSFGPQPTDDRASVVEWLPARVPGDIRADLIAAGRIPPVETPEGISAGAWVDDCDWWYRVELPGGLAPGEIAILEADGIDYYSAIWLDGRLLATHAGMFCRQTVVLSPWLNTPGAHELAIRIWGGGALPRLPNPPWRRAMRWLVDKLSPGTEYFPDRMMTPKAQFSFGWDFAPRLLSAGIWDDIRLVIARSAYIEDLWVQAEPLAEEQGSDGAEERWSRGAVERRGWDAEMTTPARIEVRLRVRRWQFGPLRAQVTVEPEGFSAASEPQDLGLSACKEASAGTGSVGPRHSVSRVLREDRPEQEEDLNLALNLDLSLDLPSTRLWWPWDQGEPCLYRVAVQLLDDSGVLDEASQVVGLRTVARTAFSDGGKWRWLINGRPVFLRGANWVPADVLPGRVTDADYARLLGMAREAGINFLRVWGGGVREKRTFWETCDRLGIMAWQEFPLVCAFLDHHPRDAVCLSALAGEARGVVLALRNHPSLIAWCGGNEINPARERLPLQALATVLAEEDPARPWIPASPCDGDVHQWQVWHGLAPWADLAEAGAPFMSEFGLQALPDAATVAEMFPGGAPASLDDPRWTAVKAQAAKLRHYAGPDANGDMLAAIAATQRAQATALQVGIEACRLRRENLRLPFPDLGGMQLLPPGLGGRTPCGGVAFWQLNEPWPAVSWSVIDRAGRPKAVCEMLRRCYQPILIAARFPWHHYAAGDTFRAEVWLVNDRPETWQGCRADVMLDGEAIWSAERIELPPAGATRIGELNLTLVTFPRFLSLALCCGEAILATNRYDLAVHLPGRQPQRTRLIHRIAEWLLETD